MPLTESSPFQWLAEEVAARLSQAIGSMTGEPTSAAASPGLQAVPQALLWWEQPLSFPPSAAVYLGVSDTTAR